MELPSKTLQAQLLKASKPQLLYQSLKWFEGLYLNRLEEPTEHLASSLLLPGKIYCYPYDPKYADKLLFFDNLPIMLCLGHYETKEKKLNACGLNLSFLPPDTRAAVLDRFVRAYTTRGIRQNARMLELGDKGSKQQGLEVTWELVKFLLAGSGFEFAYRSYIYTRMLQEPIPVPYAEWWRLSLFASRQIQKLNIRAIYYRQRRFVNDSYRIGQKTPKTKFENRKLRPGGSKK